MIPERENAPVRWGGGRGSLPGVAAYRIESLEFSRPSRETTVSTHRQVVSKGEGAAAPGPSRAGKERLENRCPDRTYPHRLAVSSVPASGRFSGPLAMASIIPRHPGFTQPKGRGGGASDMSPGGGGENLLGALRLLSARCDFRDGASSASFGADRGPRCRSPPFRAYTNLAFLKRPQDVLARQSHNGQHIRDRLVFRYGVPAMARPRGTGLPKSAGVNFTAVWVSPRSPSLLTGSGLELSASFAHLSGSGRAPLPHPAT